VAFVAVTDLDAAEAFYAGRLGMVVRERSPIAVVLDTGGTTLRATLVEQVAPPPGTVVGWRVADIAATVARLADRGVPALRFPGFDQDAAGVWTAPGGDRVAWFADPDGNTLSVTQPAPST
jgi:catechol 2,3-dioxygenase-like lactoylglutathione lyase family enzyme